MSFLKSVSSSFLLYGEAGTPVVLSYPLITGAQFGVFGRPGRDPRGRTISVAWLGLVRGAKARARAGSDASEAAWWPARRSPAMAFDHDEILAGALGRLREKARRGPFGRELLPPRFTLEQLRSLYQCVLRRHVDGRRLCGVLRRVGHAVPVAGSSASRSRTGVSLYRFDRVTYNRLMRGGFLFTTESEGRKRT